MSVKAVGKQVGISPKRVRLLLRAIQGMPVSDAIESLRFQPGSTAENVSAILRSAAANAENNNSMDPTRLKVVTAYADQAVSLRRFRARSRGRVGHVRRKASHITIVVDENEQ
jgi:large subunit ribosomal protein L22